MCPSLRSGHNLQRQECSQLDVTNVGAAVRDSEALSPGEGEVNIACCHSRKLTGVLVLEYSEPSVLRTLVANNACSHPDEGSVTAGCKSFRDVLKSCNRVRREGCSQFDGVVEVRDREVVLAWLDRLNTEVA